MDFIWFLLIGAVAGWLAGQIMKGSGFGMLGNIIVGVLGAMIGAWLFGKLGFSSSGELIPRLITALVGAVILLSILGFVSKKKN